MSKYSYLNLNQKMIKIRKKIPSLIRKRYSEDVGYDFVKLDDINQFLSPALSKYGVDFDILREIPTQTDGSGHPQFLMKDGNLWRYEADLEICWTNADHPEEKILSTLHLIGSNDVPDKAKGAAMTYGLKYYLLNKFSIPQNGAEDPDMQGAPKPPQPKPEKPRSGKEEKQKGTDLEESLDLEEGLDQPTGLGQKKERHGRDGNAVSVAAVQEGEVRLSVPETEAPKAETPKAEIPKAEVPAQKKEEDEEDVSFSDEETEETGEKAADLENEFRPVTETDSVPFSDAAEEPEPEAAEPEDEVEKAKAVICNFGLFKGQPLSEMLKTPKGWESLKWLAGRYAGANKEMKEAAKVLVESGAYEANAA